MTLNNILIDLVIISGFCVIPSSFITGRYFDRLLESKNLPKPIGMGILPFAIMRRTNLYTGYIIWNGPKKRQRKTYRDQIGDFSFRAHARLIDYLFILIEMIGAIALIWLLILI